MAKPASMIEKPQTWVRKRTLPRNMAVNPIEKARVPALAQRNEADSNRARSSRGLGTMRQRHTNSATSAAALSIVATNEVLVQPQSSVMTMPKAARASPPASSTTPSGSGSRPGLASRPSGSTRRPTK